MAANLLKAGHKLTVWNRTQTAANELLKAGATTALTPREAVTEADVVLSMVRDDEASRHVWLDADTGALHGMKPGAIAIESSTLTPGWIKTLAFQMAEHKQPFVEAPVSGSRPQAASGTLIWFVGGNKEHIDSIQPVLLQMGSSIYHTGTHGTAALTKLATNALMGVQVTVIAEIIGILNHEGVDAARVFNAVSATSSWSPLAGGISGIMLSDNFAPQFPAELIEKDFSYILQLSNLNKQFSTLSGSRAVFRQAIEAGLGSDNMTGVVRLFRQER